MYIQFMILNFGFGGLCCPPMRTGEFRGIDFKELSEMNNISKNFKIFVKVPDAKMYMEIKVGCQARKMRPFRQRIF